MTDQLRVALLARAGAARDQLRKALEEAGATIVAEGDPGELDPKDVKEKLAKVYLVGLEPATEKSIDRFDALFEAEGVEVMFDDTEVTAKLDGWDLNRWARHLAGKLTGREILPPAPEGAPAIGEGVDLANDAGTMLQPGLPETPAEQMAGAKLEDYTADSSELAEWVPTSPSLTDAPKADAGGEEGFAWQPAPASEGETSEFKLDTDLGIDVDLGALEFAPTPEPGPEPALAAGEYGAHDISDLPEMPSGEAIRFSSFDGDGAGEQIGDVDADVAALAAQLEAFEKSDTRGAAREPEFARAKQDEAAVQDAPAARVSERAPATTAASTDSKKTAVFDFSKLSLEPSDGEAALEKAPPIEARFDKASEPMPAAAKSSFGELSLEGDAPAPAAAARAPAGKPAAGAGVVLILAGLGGPDAVRQLLSTLPDRLAVPVLLYQHLEVGKHERLVEQLAKISKLPVVLARDGDVPEAGKVALLPGGMTALANGGGLKFAPGSLSQLISALPPAESMVIVLSGADAQLVPMILSVKDGGGIVLAQDPEVCFDAAAADAMRKEGAAVYPALGLAKQVATRWPA